MATKKTTKTANRRSDNPAVEQVAITVPAQADETDQLLDQLAERLAQAQFDTELQRRTAQKLNQLLTQPNPEQCEWLAQRLQAYGLLVAAAELANGLQAAVGLKALELLQKEAKQKQIESGGNRGNQYTAMDLPVEVNSPQPANRKPQARDIAAKTVGVSGQAVQRAKAIRDEAPELYEEVAKGDRSINSAWNAVKQKRAAKEPKQGEVEQGALEQAYFALMHHLASYYPPAGIKQQRLSDEELQRLQRCLVLPQGGNE